MNDYQSTSTYSSLLNSRIQTAIQHETIFEKNDNQNTVRKKCKVSTVKANPSNSKTVVICHVQFKTSNTEAATTTGSCLSLSSSSSSGTQRCSSSDCMNENGRESIQGEPESPKGAVVQSLQKLQCSSSTDDVSSLDGISSIDSNSKKSSSVSESIRNSSVSSGRSKLSSNRLSTNTVGSSKTSEVNGKSTTHYCRLDYKDILARILEAETEKRRSFEAEENRYLEQNSCSNVHCTKTRRESNAVDPTRTRKRKKRKRNTIVTTTISSESFSSLKPYKIKKTKALYGTNNCNSTSIDSKTMSWKLLLKYVTCGNKAKLKGSPYGNNSCIKKHRPPDFSSPLSNLQDTDSDQRGNIESDTIRRDDEGDTSTGSDLRLLIERRSRISQEILAKENAGLTSSQSEFAAEKTSTQSTDPKDVRASIKRSVTSVQSFHKNTPAEAGSSKEEVDNEKADIYAYSIADAMKALESNIAETKAKHKIPCATAYIDDGEGASPCDGSRYSMVRLEDRFYTLRTSRGKKYIGLDPNAPLTGYQQCLTRE